MKSRQQSVPAIGRVESLEVRRLLSASVISAIPMQDLTTGQSTPPISLGSYFRDSAIPAGDSVVELKTNLPAPNDVIPIELTDSATPQTVANFLRYITSGEYASSIIHRNSNGFVLQGGQFYPDGSAVTQFAAIPSEAATAALHNTIGTLTAVLSSSPNSATDGFFFNMANNDGSGKTPDLNDTSDGGPFTTFGKVIYNGMSVLTAIAALPVVDASAINFAWNTLPVLDANVGTPGISSQAASDNVWVPGTLIQVGAAATMLTNKLAAGDPGGSAPAASPNDIASTIVPSEPASNLVVLNPQILPGGLTYTVTSANPAIVTGSVINGQLTLTAGSHTGSTKITITATDLGGGTARQTFSVKQENRPAAGGGISMALASPLPSSLTAGSSLPNNFRIRFADLTFDGVQGSVAAAIVLSTSDQVVDPVATLASTSFELNLKYRGSRTVKLSSAPAVPSSIPAGTYHVMLADGWGVGLSYDTGKTITVKAPTVDLAGAFTRTPAAAKAGKRTSVTFTISNVSSASVAATGMLPYQIEASPDGLLSDATVIATGKKKITLKPGKRLPISMPITLKQTGTEMLILVIDPNNAVFPDDSNPSNNVVISSAAITVS